MGEIIGAMLPFVAGVALSPVPLIAVILTLFSERGRSASVGFLVGWMLGLAAMVSLVAALATVIPRGDGGEAAPWTGWILVALGVTLLVLAVRSWRSRPGPDEEPVLPSWMKTIDALGFAGALRLGVVLSVANPKVVVFCLTVGIGLGTAALTTGELIAAIIVFVVLSSSTVAAPVVAYLVASDRLRAPLARLRDWIARENQVIMAVLFAVLGWNAIGDGIATIWP